MKATMTPPVEPTITLEMSRTEAAALVRLMRHHLSGAGFYEGPLHRFYVSLSPLVAHLSIIERPYTPKKDRVYVCGGEDE